MLIALSGNGFLWLVKKIIKKNKIKILYMNLVSIERGVTCVDTSDAVGSERTSEFRSQIVCDNV